MPSRTDILDSIRAWESQHGFDVRDVHKTVRYGRPIPEGLSPWDAQEGHRLWAAYLAAKFSEEIDWHVRARERETNPPEVPPFYSDDIPF